MKSAMLNKLLKEIKSSKILLYTLFVLTIIHIIGFILQGNVNNVAVLVSLGLIISYFTKNMVVIFGLTLLITNLYLHVSQPKEVETETEAFETQKKKKSGFQNKKKTNNKKKSGFQNKNNTIPSSKPAKVDEVEEIGKRIDYSVTMEKAYDNLSEMLGTGGIKKLTSDTENLINQQKSLMSTLKDIQPLVGMAKDTLGSLDVDKLMSSVDTFNSVLNKK